MGATQGPVSAVTLRSSALSPAHSPGASIRRGGKLSLLLEGLDDFDVGEAKRNRAPHLLAGRSLPTRLSRGGAANMFREMTRDQLTPQRTAGATGSG
jgi:hypothetical protein